MWPGYQMSLRKQVLASGKWVNLGSDKCTEISWYETILLSHQAVLKHMVSNDFIFCARDRFCILPRMKKSMGLFHIKSFSCHVTILLKRKLQHVGHKWVMCGSHLDCSMGQWVKWVNRCDPLSTLFLKYLIKFRTQDLYIHKLNYYGINRNLLSWIKAFWWIVHSK